MKGKEKTQLKSSLWKRGEHANFRRKKDKCGGQEQNRKTQKWKSEERDKDVPCRSPQGSLETFSTTIAEKNVSLDSCRAYSW